MNSKDVKDESLTTTFSEISQKISQLEARFTGPLNPQVTLPQDTNKHIQPVQEISGIELTKQMFTPEKKQNIKFEDSAGDDSLSSLPYKRRKDSSPLLLPKPGEYSRTGASLSCSQTNQGINRFEDSDKKYQEFDNLKEEIYEKMDELSKKLHATEFICQEKQNLLLIAEKRNQELLIELEKKTAIIQSNSAEIDSLQELTKRGKKALINTLRSLEDKKRKELKARIFNDSFRLGRVTMVRSGTKFQEYWEDGQEITQTRSQLEALIKQKETLEKEKKKLKKSNDEELSATLPLRLALLMREEIELKEKLEKLEIEKNIHIQDCRRIAEEESAQYSKTTSDHEAWPVLHGRYLLLSLLGKGGYSEVYRAYDLFEHIDLAIKFHQLNSSWAEVIKANFIKHALRENKIHRELNHPRIVKHYDTLEVDNNCFCTVLEYCPGEDLNIYMKRHKLVTEKEAKSIMQQIFAGLRYLNEQQEKIIHYDLKPHNILLNNGEVKITDFGLSKIMDPNMTNLELTSQGVGTYWYQAPECFECGTTPPKINSKVDVWSAGIIFFELLYGAKPFGNNMGQDKVLKEQIIIKATNVNFPAKPSVSNECKEFIRKCLEYNVDDRLDVLDAVNSVYLQVKR